MATAPAAGEAETAEAVAKSTAMAAAEAATKAEGVRKLAESAAADAASTGTIEVVSPTPTRQGAALAPVNAVSTDTTASVTVPVPQRAPIRIVPRPAPASRPLILYQIF